MELFFSLVVFNDSVTNGRGKLKMEHFVERLQIRPVEAGRSRTLFIKNVRVLRTYSNYDFWFIGVFSLF
jgi:hypothetical protein